MIRKILFVDDDRVLQIIARHQLDVFAEQFSFVFANDGLDAIKKLEDGCFSLVCIDLIMPRMKGVNLFSHIRSHFPQMPAIIFSAKSKKEMQVLVPPAGVLDYFTKPFRIGKLGECIMQYLQQEARGGIMHNVSPPVFFQLMEMEAKTCTARVLDNGSQQGGVLYFSDGQLLDARVGMITGLDAALKVFGWNEATVFIENNCPEMENSINLSLQSVIMRAVSMKDEESEAFDFESPEQGGAQDFPSVQRADGSRATQPTLFTEICEVLAAEVAAKRIDDISQNIERRSVVGAMAQIGEQQNFGAFQVGIINNGTAKSTILIPGKSPIEITCPSESHAKGIVKILDS
ncbi:MAG: hypothetical protein COA36_09495 [Desulfotalea sp.]|nr:MAG: hypothetical protein COA36_09495 [Desulfotalea sp.]